MVRNSINTSKIGYFQERENILVGVGDEGGGTEERV